MSDAIPTGAAADQVRIGPYAVRGNVLLAPMSGITDYPFRKLVHGFNAGLVVSEMVASEHLVRDRHGARLRSDGRGLNPWVIQLAGCEARWMAEGARFAESLGANVIDINMGCPAREVTGKLSGSALMRDLDHAERLIESVVTSVSIPVTLKMRLGWDDNSFNAPDLARRAESAGVRLITVHARTRCQFFKGQANWSMVRHVKNAVRVPTIVNGDIVDPASARAALDASGADGVMVGRGACGAPWIPARIARALVTGEDGGPPPLAEQHATAVTHVEGLLSQYGRANGLRNSRKHIGWYLQSSGRATSVVKSWRRRLCTSDDPIVVFEGLRAFYRDAEGMAA